MRPVVSFALVSLLFACGERPQRVDVAAPASTPVSPPEPTPRFAGRVVLEGELATARSGAVFLSARRKGQRLPALSQKFELNDPAWVEQGPTRVLAFTLTDANNMGGFGTPLGAEMEVEARFDPDGFIDPSPGAQDPGVVKAAVPASPGDKAIAITMRPGPPAK